MSGWRRKVLNSLNDARGVLRSSIPAATMEKMYEIANYCEPRLPSQEPAEVAQTLSTVKLVSAECSFIQSVRTEPYHFQIIVPNASGTATANQQYIYEVAVWERSLLEIFWNEGVNCTRFEVCNCEQPLIIDIFGTPECEAAPLFWRSALEELSGEHVIQVNTRSLKGVFGRGTGYAAVAFDDGNGWAVATDAHDVRACACDVVASMWRDSNDKPPTTLERAITCFGKWA